MITVKFNTQYGKEVEQFTNDHFVDYNVVASKRCESGLFQKETNDCVVKAFMVALDLTYDQAHDYIRVKMNRENRRGTYTYIYSRNIINTIKNGKRVTFMGAHPNMTYMQTNIANTTNKKILANPKYKKPTGFTLKSFIENHPVGRFVLVVEGHAMACVDGVLYGNPNERQQGLYRSVWYGFEMK